MKSLRPALHLGLVLALVLAACGTDGGERSRGETALSPAEVVRGARLAQVTGTVVDALSGAPVAGATIEGPGGTRATSDARGRFTLSGLPLGAEGELVARSADGAEARNRLRPLQAGTLEVVLRLRRP